MIQTIRVRTNKNPTARVYRLEGITEKQAKILAEKLFRENVNQTYTINKPIFPNAIEIAYKMGVMNPEVASIIKAARDLKVNLIACDSSREYLNKAPIFNPLTEHIVKKEPTTLLIKEKAGKTAVIPIREMGDKELLSLSKDKLFLNLDEMKTIQKYFQKIRRDPTDLELETLAQTWSEHCAHKTFKAKLIIDGKSKAPLIERIKKEALKHKKNVVSAFVDNAGVMDFYDGWAINGKAETHNAPSAIEPYGGAMTGSGGVFRDVVATGQGAKCVVSTDIFCLAPPGMDKNKLPSGTLPPDYILKRVVSAVRDYGNRVGIPTNNGSFHFHEDFRAKPIVLVGSYGILPKTKAKKGKPKVGDVGVVIGGRIGRDGIHGATFSSGEMSERTMKVNATAVQIGNAIEEKRVFDAILEARDQDLIRAVQDLGAGGFSSAIGEMGEKTGVAVHLEKAPLKYQGLSPWEIWVSESQERMLIILPPKNLKKFLEICKKYNVEATEIVEFDGSRKLQVYFNKKQVGDLEMTFLHGGLPQRVMRATYVKVTSPSRLHLNIPKTKKRWINHLEKILSHGNINSKEPILRMYDHNVQGTNALHPFTGVGMDGPNDAAVIRPLLDKPYGLVVAHGLNPVFTMMDPYWGSIWAGAEAISNYVAVGGDYKNASLINNYIWPFPDEEWLGKLDRCVDAVCNFMKALKIPVISGKDSLSATYRGSNGFVLHSPPTLCISAFGRIPDVRKTVSSDLKNIGSTIVLVGQEAHLRGEAKTLPGSHLGGVPRVDLKMLPRVLEKMHKAIISGKVLACHDVSEGGLIITIFEMCVGGNCGVEIKVDGKRLLSETAGCFIVEVENEKMAKRLFKGIPYKILGKTIKDEKLIVEDLFTADVNKLQKAWQKPMKEVFG
ncbi:phosphoribosylformylglycinamidine synthase [Candidatus Daviesbacteria bacterium RIFCSPLOWO2_01_FULL_39_12]|uniref:Phosphoribosylformylglycinamidine synthase subunit PurL n=1 Tax=Candidatus Daviesbacteria bacterium RIFCSPLOWO2_01_FULL_39_12 TaxID=1797785 RepID=A0A1F5KTX8_9BACT|nr:MAG: phosphoribosylformylglycinamidine synthase [Candidatus Daviesbacteria bacterium RIFCSPHIGHO2_02_FULL_39_8]OGE44388.1 MAG: phosphoribosylformylglycinamidine synthase [Candidatus Daviesbacteria bacterium RIFCSPLOWO2_01_FULL_39_12]